MTIMPSEVDDTSSDADIELEEVSKIFRCRDCQRCYFSYSKFAEHFPIHHPDKVTASSAQSARKKTTPKKINSDHDSGGAETIEKAKSSESSTVQERRKISLKPCQLFAPDFEENVSLQSENSRTSPTKINGIQLSSGSVQYSPLHVEVEDDSSNQEIRKTRMKSKSNENSHSENSGIGLLQLAPTIPPNDSVVVVEQEVEDACLNKSDSSEGQRRVKEKSKSCDDAEVITISDSDDDDDNRPFANSSSNPSHNKVSIKQEIDTHKDESIERNVELHEEIPEKVNDQAQAAEENKLSPKRNRKKYSCHYCSKQFSRDSTLNSHLRAKHQAELENEQIKSTNKNVNENEGCPSEKSNNLDNGNITDFSKNSNGKRALEKETLQKKGKKIKQTPSLTKKKGPEKEKINTPNRRPQLLTFSCKWCSDKFENLETLKQHAVNIHIKYKTTLG